MIKLLDCVMYVYTIIYNTGRNKEYSKVDDINDTRVPLHNEDAFQHGLKFKAKVWSLLTNIGSFIYHIFNTSLIVHR